MTGFCAGGGDGEADIHPAADGDHGVGIEAAQPVVSCLAPAWRTRPTVSRRKWAAPRIGVGPALAQPGHQHVAGAGGEASSG